MPEQIPSISLVEQKILKTKKIFIVILLFLTLTVGLTIFLFAKTIEQKNAIKTQEESIAALAATFKLKSDNLKRMNKKLANINEILTKFISSNKSKINDEKDIYNNYKSIQTLNNSRFLVGFYSYNQNNFDREKIAKYLTDQGYNLKANIKLSTRPTWLSPQSSLFYYSPQSLKKAKSIALDLQKISGKQFKVIRGAGLGVLRGREEWTYNIHYIGENKN